MSVSNATDWPSSALDAAATAFAALTCEPAPLVLDCAAFGSDTGLPQRMMPLPALRDWLLRHPRAYTARDEVWRELIRRARLDGPHWVVAAVGMAMPAMLQYAARLCEGYDGDPADVDAEILTGFLGALRDRADLTKPAPYASLCKAAWRAGRDLRLQQQDYLPVEDIEHFAPGPRAPRVPYGHPDLLVRRAVTLGILDPEDEQAYIDVRLGYRAIEPIAAANGVSVDALRMRLSRIDSRIADALADGLLTGVASPETVAQLRLQAEQRGQRRAGRAAAARREAARVRTAAAA
jgi:DNA-directed RNA polymerase specialized sigma24 family protein